MSWHLWIAFVAASLLLALIPGPGVMSIVGYAIEGGRRVALAAVAGMAVGNAIAMTLSLAGVGALLATSASAFLVLKWLGASYLIGYGLLTLLRRRTDAGTDTPEREPAVPARAFFGNVLVGTFHPKTIVFFVAFVPQFIDAQHRYGPQAVLLVLTFIAVVGLSDTFYALLAAHASNLLRAPSVSAWARRVSGSVMIAAGAATAASRS